MKDKLLIIGDGHAHLVRLNQILNETDHPRDLIYRCNTTEAANFPTDGIKAILLCINMVDEYLTVLCRRFPDTPLIVMTSVADTGSLAAMIRQGAADVLPIDTTDGAGLLRAIAMATARLEQKPARHDLEQEKLQTDSLNAELARQIKEQKQELDCILYSINDAIWSRMADTHELLYGNKAYYNLYGLTPEELANDKDHAFNDVYPEDRPIFEAAIKETMATGKTEVVYRHRNKDGKLRILKVQAVLRKGVDGKPDRITGMTTDITQEKQLFDAMRNNEQTLLATINNTKDLIWSVDTNLNITFCNTAYQDFFINRNHVALDKGDHVLGNWYSKAFIAKRTSDYQRALAGESFLTIVEENFNSQIQYNEISSNPIINQDGRIVGVNCIARDISAARNQFIAIRELSEQLKGMAMKTLPHINEQLSLADQTEASVIQELNSLIKDIRSIAITIDALYPDTQEIIARL